MAKTNSLEREIVDSIAYCSFCTKPQTDVAVLVAGPGVYVCNECVAMCNEVIAQTLNAKNDKAASKSKHDPIAYLESVDSEKLKEKLIQRELVRQNVGNIQQMIVDVLRSRKVSWAEIGDSLGVSRQAVWQRFRIAD